MDDARERVYKRTYTSLKMHGLRNGGLLRRRELPALNMPTTPEVLDDVLNALQSEGQLFVQRDQDGDVVYDLLPFLEHALAESALDLPVRLELAKIYLGRKMWTPAIAELRVTQTHPKLKKDSLYLLGGCFEKKGAIQKARECYERTLAIDYFYLDARERLERLMRQPQTNTSATAVGLFDTTQTNLSALLQDRYELVRELGRGGAGVVFQAVDYKLKRDVAIKLLHHPAFQQGDARREFLQEARVAAQLEHPNLIEIYDVDIAAECIVMEFVDGGTLRDLLSVQQRLPLEQACDVIKQLCQGLQFAHQAGVLHRDIKPANIFITKKKRVKLGDFGIAHLTNVEQNDFTQISAQIGTLPYMSPEQVQEGRLCPASDIYAVGVVFYEMLTGQPPFINGDIAYHHVYTPPAPPGVSPMIDALILRCLEKDPAKRPQSAEEFANTLRAQMKQAAERLNKYREMLKMAVIDREISHAERMVLKMKRAALNLTDEEARRVEQEFGLNLQ